MVREEAQMYTIEGFAAVLIMLVTAYLILGTSQIYTPADSHITEMQLEQLGHDALAMMDTPLDKSSAEIGMSNLTYYLEDPDNPAIQSQFANKFMEYMQMRTGASQDAHLVDEIRFNSTVYYYYTSVVKDEVKAINFADSSNYDSEYESDPIARETAVRVSRWVTILIDSSNDEDYKHDLTDGYHTVLLEVLIWRG
jgi:hypothetical protein